MKPSDKRTQLYLAAVNRAPARPYVGYGASAIRDRHGNFKDVLGEYKSVTAVRLDQVGVRLALSVRMVGGDKLSLFPYQTSGPGETYRHRWTAKCRRCGLDSRYVVLRNKHQPCCSKGGKTHVDVLMDSLFLPWLSRNVPLEQVYETVGIDVFNAQMLAYELVELQDTFHAYTSLTPREV